MAKILGFKHKLSYYLSLIDSREESGDLWGVLDACRNAKRLAKCKMKKQSFDVLIANTYFKMEQHFLACESFFKAIFVPELRCACLFGIGRSLCCLDMFDLGLEYFQTALKWDEQNKFTEEILWWSNYVLKQINNQKTASKNVLNHAKFLLKQKNYKMAQQTLLPILKSEKKAQNFYALLFLLDGQNDKANELNKQNLQQKDNIFAMCLQFEIFKKNGNQKGQETMLQQILAADSSDVDYLINKALFLAKLKNFEGCYNTLKQCLKKAEFNPKLHLFCSQVCYNLGKTEDALYHVSRARWIDFDNPIYMFYYDLFKKNELKKPAKITEKFDSENARKKVLELDQNLDNQNFITLMFKNHFLLEDLSFGMTYDNQICNKASAILASAKQKEAKQFFSNFLMSAKPTIKQKFFMLRHAFFCEKFNTIRFVSGYRYFQIKTQKQNYINFDYPIKAGICNAFSYAFCNCISQEIIEKILKNAKNICKKTIFKTLNESELACLMLCDNMFIFENACSFFDVDISKLLLFKNLINFSNLENYENQTF